MLLSLALLSTAALSIAVINLILIESVMAVPHGAVYLTLLIVADVAVFVKLGEYQLRKLVLGPLETVVKTAEAIAEGDLSRRVPPAGTTELDRLGASINRMTTRLLEEQAQRAHLEKVASVGRLAAGVAHEIGNPLGAIMGYSHMLRTAVSDDPLAAEAVAGIEREGARIDRIMRGMLDYARPRRRSAQPLDVNDTVQRAVELLTEQGVLRGVGVTLSLQKRMPHIHADAHEMEQVLVNLLLNAVDAIGGEGTVSITTRCTPFSDAAGVDGERGEQGGPAISRVQSARVRAWLNTVGKPSALITLIVSDTGPGIPPADTERIFDPFFTTKDPGKGTGLGLAIVARVIEGLGGTVWARGSREGGAAIIAYIPVPDAHPADGRKRPHASLAHPSHARS
jgi:signal transduction histidine kinase